MKIDHATDVISSDPRGRNVVSGDEEDGNLSSGSVSSIEDQDGKGGSSKIRTLRSNVSDVYFISSNLSARPIVNKKIYDHMFEMTLRPSLS